jgi:hypothetical protein
MQKREQFRVGDEIDIAANGRCAGSRSPASPATATSTVSPERRSPSGTCRPRARFSTWTATRASPSRPPAACRTTDCWRRCETSPAPRRRSGAARTRRPRTRRESARSSRSSGALARLRRRRAPCRRVRHLQHAVDHRRAADAQRGALKDGVGGRGLRPGPRLLVVRLCPALSSARCLTASNAVGTWGQTL